MHCLGRFGTVDGRLERIAVGDDLEWVRAGSIHMLASDERQGFAAQMPTSAVLLPPSHDRYRDCFRIGLQWNPVDFERGHVVLNPRDRVQTSKYRATVPMNDQIQKALLDAYAGALSDYVIEHGTGKVGSIRKGFAAAAKRADLKVTSHMLRHSAAMWMAEADRPMMQIAQFLGHTDSRITERVYARFSPSFLKDSAKALTW